MVRERSANSRPGESDTCRVQPTEQTNAMRGKIDEWTEGAGQREGGRGGGGHREGEREGGRRRGGGKGERRIEMERHREGEREKEGGGVRRG